MPNSLSTKQFFTCLAARSLASVADAGSQRCGAVLWIEVVPDTLVIPKLLKPIRDIIV